MPLLSPVSQRTERALVALTDRPRRRAALAAAGALALVATVALQGVAWVDGVPLSGLLRVAQAASVAVVSGAGGLLLARALRRQAEPHPRVLWQVLLVTLGVLAVGRALVWALLPAGADDDTAAAYGFAKNGAPRIAGSLALMPLMALADLFVAVYALVRLREFVLFKRTRGAVRNWGAMLAAFVVAALLVEAREEPGAEFDLASQIVVGVASALAVVNAVRISWIVYLPLRQKLATIGLTLLLMAVFVVAADGGLTAGGTSFVAHYSPGLAVFIDLAFGFGALYSVATFLFLLFHLPTSTDFQRSAGERRALGALTDLTGAAFDPARLGEAIASAPVTGGSADRAWLALVDPLSGSLRPTVVAAHGLDLDTACRAADCEALFAEIDATGQPLRLDDAFADHRIHAVPDVRIGSLLGVPLVARGRVLGVLFAARDVAHAFERDDEDSLRLFASQAALALEHARMFEDQVEKERLRSELDIARAVQQRLLPQTLPDVRGLALCAASVPALEVGGDYYDFAPLDDDRLAVIVADVSGKGTSAAFYMAELKGIFRALAHRSPTPLAFLREANRALAPALAPGVFVTALYAIVDPVGETVQLARAGHCPAALVPAEGPVRYVEGKGLGLGLDRRGIFERTLNEIDLPLAPGDTLVLYTDGIVESRSEADEEYGYDRLLDALTRHRALDAPALHAALLDDLHGFLGTNPYGDDLTLVVLKWHGAPADASSDGAASESSLPPHRTRGPLSPIPALA